MKQYIKRFIQKNFAKYLVIGIFATFISTFSLYVLVDILGLQAWYSNIFVSALIFFMKFIGYHKVDMFDGSKKRSNFIKYVGVWFLMLGVSSLALWVTVDKFIWPVVIVNPFVVVGTFLLRFMLFSKLKMLKQLD